MFMWTKALVNDSIPQRLTFFLIYTTFLTLCLTATYFAANRNLKYAELHGPILFGGFASISIFMSLTQPIEIETETYIQTQSLSIITFLIYIGVVCPQF